MTELDRTKKVADRYLKREVLGEGTYGVVYKAIDTKVNWGGNWGRKKDGLLLLTACELMFFLCACFLGHCL